MDCKIRTRSRSCIALDRTEPNQWSIFGPGAVEEVDKGRLEYQVTYFLRGAALEQNVVAFRRCSAINPNPLKDFVISLRARGRQRNVWYDPNSRNRTNGSLLNEATP